MAVSPVDNSRQCGPCTACCTYLPIPAGEVSAEEKPAGVRCVRLCATGCSIYHERPTMCSSFRCAWHVDATWPDTWRPRESGLLCLKEVVDGVGSAALVYELVRGALDRAVGDRIVQRLLQTSRAVIVVDALEQRRMLVAHGRHEHHRPAPHLARARRTGS